jgi:hypothetical protein
MLHGVVHTQRTFLPGKSALLVMSFAKRCMVSLLAVVAAVAKSGAGMHHLKLRAVKIKTKMLAAPSGHATLKCWQALCYNCSVQLRDVTRVWHADQWLLPQGTASMHAALQALPTCEQVHLRASTPCSTAQQQQGIRGATRSPSLDCC